MSKQKKKGGCGTIILVIIILGIIGNIFGKNDDKEKISKETSTVSESTEKTEKNKEENNDNEDVSETETANLSEELNVFSSGEYLFITNDDLNKYSVNMDGVKVYVVTEIDDMKDDTIQSTLTDGYIMSNFHVGDKFENYEKFLKKEDVVAILGTVSESTDYKFVGKSVELNDCLVFAVGDEAKSYAKEASDEGLSQYFVVTEEVADSDNEISEEDYKGLCEYLDYEDILRNPDNNDGKYCVVTGSVDQIIEGLFGGYIIYVEDSSGNKWECSYSYKDGESHLLEGDNVTIYGKCKGTTTATTVLGEQVTIPDIRAEYLN